jgi:hypothetical protein
MKQSQITNLVVWITIGLIGLGLAAHKGIFALTKARQVGSRITRDNLKLAARSRLWLHLAANSMLEREVGEATMTTSTVWLWLSFGLIVLGLSACSDDFVALIS